MDSSQQSSETKLFGKAGSSKKKGATGAPTTYQPITQFSVSSTPTRSSTKTKK